MLRTGYLGLCLLTALPSNAATLVIRAEGIQPGNGTVYAGVCDKSFDETSCPYKDREPARAGVVEMRIRNVKPGVYAVAVFQDLNGNGSLDRNLIGLPREPYGFSNDTGRRGPPSFQEALVTIQEPSTTVTIPVR
ncbi:DUF2141 domain-containing protein [Microvirga rosea]|uniref:DUF2141 domain-containing protein n=1 Tax=Microvirga rosea TaxID=2715425 RepID=UPI001D0A08F9|nr:DUF2141 domain-containing protein [Microvirga rosea]MCB8822982.1 DUF2141 domain-containing protein [Microvirga rosea]